MTQFKTSHHQLQSYTALGEGGILNTLVTGGSGFIGSNLVRALLDRGHSVRVLDNLSTGRQINLEGLQVEHAPGNLEDAEAVREACRDIEVVFHEGALPSVKRSVEDPAPTHEVNATGTLNVLMAARAGGAKRVVYASSSSVYGDTPTLPKEEAMSPSPRSPYAVSKLTGELYCKVFTSVYGLPTVGLRYFNVFGPRQDPKSHYAAVIPLFATALLKGERPTVFGDGEQTRDFTYIENVVSANLLAAQSDERAWGQAFNVAVGERVTLNVLLKMLSEIIGSEGIEPNYTDPRPGDVRHSLADISKARELLGYQPEVDLGDGLVRTVDWFRAEIERE